MLEVLVMLLLIGGLVGAGSWLLILSLPWVRNLGERETITPEDIQVRVMTVGKSPHVVQETVDSALEFFTDVRVVSEHDMEIDSAPVHVVPKEFQSNAIRKGRALEWARQNVENSRSHVLYLDEDSVICSVPESIPKADVIQLPECPVNSGSLLAYLSEIHRIGFQLEMKYFSHLKIPLYAWGGGIILSSEVEDAVTWDWESVCEDTVFVWKAVQMGYTYTNCYHFHVENQAPPSVVQLIKQRRRWVSGATKDIGVLPRFYRYVSILRNFSWGVSGYFSAVSVPLYVFGEIGLLFVALSMVYVALLFGWMLIGMRTMDSRLRYGVLLLFLFPVVHAIHSTGALIGILFPARDFDVTEKV